MYVITSSLPRSVQLQSALLAVEHGTAVVIANGIKQAETIMDIVKGKPVGTLVTKNGHSELAVSVDTLADDGEALREPLPLLVTPPPALL